MTDCPVTIVTGAGSGIGAALCRMLAAPGHAIVVHTGANRENAAAVAAEVVSAGALALVSVHRFDEPERAALVADEALRAFGRIDRIVHVAGMADRRPFGTLDAAGYEAALSAIPRAFFHLVTAALPYLRAAPAARVVSVGSFVAHARRLGDDLRFPATASAKAALVSLTQSLAAQLAADRIPVNCVVPGFVTKDAGRHAALDDVARARALAVIPMGRFAEPREIAAAIRFLLSDDAAYITGQTLMVDGGITL